MKLWRWVSGRQNSGYDKLFLFGLKWPIAFDLYILRFSEGSEIPIHKDAVESGRHFRLNIVLKQAHIGGKFTCSSPIFETRRIKLFRPDISEHSVTRVESGSRYVLSLGWLRK